jgi:predicted transcriptional regulator
MASEGPKTVGELEATVLEVLWSSKTTLSIRDVHALVKRRPPLAYTTISTVLDRLHEKGLVAREKGGNVYGYWPRVSKEQWVGEQAASVLTRSALSSDGAVLMAFLDSAERADPSLLERLSELIARRRKRDRA